MASRRSTSTPWAAPTTITVDDLTGTDVKQVVDRPGGAGRQRPATARPTVTVNGTGGNDQINVVGAGTSFSVTGLPAQVNIDGAEGGQRPR